VHRRWLLRLAVLLGLLAPGLAHAHETTMPLVAEAPAPFDRMAAASLSTASPPASVPALAVAIVAGALLVAGWRRPRHALGLALILLLAVLAAETAVHSVHHLGDHAASACAVAATAAQLAASLDCSAPSLSTPVVVALALAEYDSSRPAGPTRGPDPARAPPAPRTPLA
jgi:hypothetical protein